MKKSFLALLLLLSLSVIPAAFAKEWDEGGLLDETDSITSWSITTDENALASSAAYLKCTTDPATLKSVTNSKLKEAATAVVACMAKVAETPGISLNEAHPYVLQCIAALKPNYPWVNTKTYASSAPVTSVSEQAASEADPAFIPGEPLPYAIYDAQKDIRRAIGRTRFNLRIILAGHNEKGQIIERTRQDDLTNGQLAATAIAAAKQCVKDTDADFVGVVLESQFLSGYNTATQLAVVDYAPDGKGASGKDNMKWNIRAAEHGLTAQQLTMQSLWSEWRGKFQKNGSLDEDALSEAIGKKLNIAPEDVNPGYMFLYAVPADFAEQIKPQPGLMPKKGNVKK